MQDNNKSTAIELFNQTWDLIEKNDKNQSDIDRMINAAHASRYHWEIAGEAVNIARGEWLISRVYALLDRGEPCWYHANRCLEITLENDLKDFDLAFAYESIARAAFINQNEVEMAKYLTLAQDSGALIASPDDQEYFFNELKTLHPDISG